MFLMLPCLLRKMKRNKDPGFSNEFYIQRRQIKLYTGGQASLYFLQICEAFQALFVEVKDKGDLPICNNKKRVGPKGVGREKSSLDDCAPGV